MDFFAAQDRARRASRWLVVGFLWAVAACIGLVYLAVVAALTSGAGPWWQPALLGKTAFVVGSVIIAGTLIKLGELSSGGGDKLAQWLGGRRIMPDTAEARERQLLHITEEMAIAAGIPVPPVYVLDHEPAINAFAAGGTIPEAVIGVTRGALEALDRDELQGVVAHEFSHIVHGDMRLNMHLLGVLHGLFMLTTLGRVLWRSSAHLRRSRDGARVVPLAIAAGLVLTVAGSLGVVFGQIIRAAISRQREYLADAAAVQFTRNPSGLAGALRKIAERPHPMTNPRAEEVSHMLFAGSLAAGLGSLLATHPPIEERIARLEGQRNLVTRQPRASSATTNERDDRSIFPDHPRQATALFSGLAAVAPPPGASAAGASDSPDNPAAFVARIGTLDGEALTTAHTILAQMPETLLARLHTPWGAVSVLLALLLDRDETIHQHQRALLDASPLSSLRLPFDEDLAKAVERALPAPLTPAMRLVLLELALPALRALSDEQRSAFLDTAKILAAADNRLSLREYLLLRALEHALGVRPASHRSSLPRSWHEAVALLLSLLAHAGHRDEAQARAAFTAGAAAAPAPDLSFLPRSALQRDALDDAFALLAAATGRYRRWIVAALAAVAMSDGRLTPAEAEALACACAALDCPVPLNATAGDGSDLGDGL